jgi:hypothetical protein
MSQLRLFREHLVIPTHYVYDVAQEKKLEELVHLTDMIHFNCPNGFPKEGQEENISFYLWQLRYSISKYKKSDNSACLSSRETIHLIIEQALKALGKKYKQCAMFLSTQGPQLTVSLPDSSSPIASPQEQPMRKKRNKNTRKKINSIINEWGDYLSY